MSRLSRVVAATLLVVAAAVAVPTSPGSAATGDGSSHTYQRLGLDTCNAPTHTEMAAFWSGSPYWWWGIYIGGANRSCANTNLTAAWISTEMARGFGLMPIWVGPQAPCVKATGNSKMSLDTATAYQQGVNEGILAYNKIVSLQMNTNTPIVYDMEAFDTTNSGCVAAVKAFMRGWTTQLHTSPAQVAGYYTSAGSGSPTAMWNISPHADFLWAAYQSNPVDTHPFDMDTYISDSIWPQRHRQYQLNTTATSNGVTLNVDKDCADGPMYSPAQLLSISSSCP